jgi:hypothetical protein
MTIILDTLYFFFRYIPFWAIPLFMICMQFGYIYWVKEVRWVAYALYAAAGTCALFLVYYIYAGSPDDSARILSDAIRSF